MGQQVGIRYFINRARKEPYSLLAGIVALLNGYWHKLKFLVLGKKVRSGRWLRVYGTFRIRGSGKVVIGDNCLVIANVFKPVAFVTARPDSFIEIGNNVGFNGTTMECFEHISIGDWCNIADAYIVDSPAHHLSADRRSFSSAEVPAAPVRIMPNVWISARVVVTHGVTIGENSVIGACSLVRSDVPANSFYAGVPAKFIKRIPPPRDVADAAGED